jgi:hypothetical protein
MNKRQQAAKLRAQKELEQNPEKYKDLGSLGGSKKVPKGTAKISKQAHQKMILASLRTRFQ